MVSMSTLGFKPNDMSKLIQTQGKTQTIGVSIVSKHIPYGSDYLVSLHIISILTPFL